MITTAGASYFILEHSRGILILVMGCLGISLLAVVSHRLIHNVFIGRLISVWGDVMPETPDGRDAETSEEKPAALSVSCPTCDAKKFEYCKTLGGLEMRLVHGDRKKRYIRFLSRHWTI